MIKLIVVKDSDIEPEVGLIAMECLALELDVSTKTPGLEFDKAEQMLDRHEHTEHATVANVACTTTPSKNMRENTKRPSADLDVRI